MQVCHAVGTGTTRRSLQDLEPLGGQSTTDKSHDPRCQNDQGKRDPEKENGDERYRCDHVHRRVLQDPLPDTQHRFEHDCQYCGLQSKEQRLHRDGLLVLCVNHAEDQNADRSGQNEQPARHQPSPDSMHQPPDIGRQLLSFGPREQHAEVECVQEPVLADPLFLVDEDAVHHSDLPRRPAKAKGSDLSPCPCSLGQRGPLWRVVGHMGSLGKL